MMVQLVQAIAPYHPSILMPDYMTESQQKVIKKGDCEIFFSYAWRNSKEAQQSKEVVHAIGTRFTDPRAIKRELEKKLGKEIWQDTERLATAGDNTTMGMFEQIATALSKAKVLVACVSKEYAESENCKMEFQFAAKSLKKPLVALIVGNSEDDWQSTSVGMIVSQLDTTIDFHGVSGRDGHGRNTSMLFDIKLNQTVDKILSIIEDKMPRDRLLAGIRRKQKPLHADHADIQTIPKKAHGKKKKKILSKSSPPPPPSIPPPPPSSSIVPPPAPPSTLPPPAPPGTLSPPAPPTFGDRPAGVIQGGGANRGGKQLPPPPPSGAPPPPIPKLPPASKKAEKSSKQIPSEPVFVEIVPFNGDRFKLELAASHNEFHKYIENTKIRDLQNLIHQKTGIKKENQRLQIKNGVNRVKTVVQPDSTLKASGLKANSIIDILFKMSEKLDSEVFKEAESEEEEVDVGGIPDEDDDGDETFEEEFSFRAPVVGDRVICNYEKQMYFQATVKKILPESMQYEVEWDDGSAEHPHHRYDELTLNIPPDSALVGKGTTVLFPQGKYKINASKEGTRWHKGIISEVYDYQNDDGTMETRYAGHHIEKLDYRFRGFSQYFHDMTIKEIRLPPNPMDVLLAFDKMKLESLPSWDL